MNDDDLRDLFAGLAMMGMLVGGVDTSNSLLASDAYDLADAMLVAREGSDGIAAVALKQRKKRVPK